LEGFKKMDVEFKIANSDNIEDIVKLCNKIFLEETNLLEAKKIYEETKNDKNQIYLIGEVNGEVIAHTKIAIIPTIFKDMNTFAILNHVCVKEEYRQHKIATKMLEEVERICSERNCTSLKLWSNNFRIPAHSCYKKFGFVANDATFFSKEI
jgi:ribosomal protein S18 acetylase RimI-like enzyme